MRYFTGFMTPFWQSPTRPWFLVLPRSGKPVAVIPTIGVPLMGSCYVGDIKVGHPLRLVMMVSVFYQMLSGAMCRMRAVWGF